MWSGLGGKICSKNRIGRVRFRASCGRPYAPQRWDNMLRHNLPACLLSLRFSRWYRAWKNARVFVAGERQRAHFRVWMWPQRRADLSRWYWGVLFEWSDSSFTWMIIKITFIKFRLQHWRYSLVYLLIYNTDLRRFHHQGRPLDSSPPLRPSSSSSTCGLKNNLFLVNLFTLSLRKINAEENCGQLPDLIYALYFSLSRHMNQ